eukprot:NODE_901_length_3188_cov_1.051797.p3 type:complete len:132 gc:universal NODE_901_length_3188_cov_1.051797:936-1331(+)
MLLIQVVLSTAVSVCWKWGYYYLNKGWLNSSTYYPWIADCCVFGSQPNSWIDGTKTSNGKKHHVKPKTIPLQIPDSTIRDTDLAVLSSGIEYNIHDKRVFKYMRVACIQQVGDARPKNVDDYYNNCIDSYT